MTLIHLKPEKLFTLCKHYSVCFTANVIVRLVGGTNSSGRVEVSKANTDSWEGVCDTSWDNDDAKVVCNMIDPRLELINYTVNFSNQNPEGTWIYFVSGWSRLLLAK